MQVMEIDVVLNFYARFYCFLIFKNLFSSWYALQ